MKKFTIFLIIAFLGLCFWVKPVLADSVPLTITVVPFADGTNYATVTTTYKDNGKTGGESVLSLTLLDSQGNPSPDQLVVMDSGSNQFIIPQWDGGEGKTSVSKVVKFPTSGNWKIQFSGDVWANNQLVSFESTSDPYWVGSPVSLSLSPVSATLHIGETTIFQASLVYGDQSAVDISDRVVWTSRDESIATFSSPNGTVFAKNAGTVNLQADDPETQLSQVAQLEVIPKAGIEIVYSPPSTLNVGETKELRANYFFYKNGERITFDITDIVSWSSSDLSVVDIETWNQLSGDSVDAKGIKPGSSTITCTSFNSPLAVRSAYLLFKNFLDPSSNFDLNILSDLNTYTATLTLDVKKLEIIPSEPQMITTGNTSLYQAILTDADHDHQGLAGLATWTSSDPEVALIDNKGLATAGSKLGKTTITVSYQGVSASAELEVVQFAITPQNKVINTGGSQQYVATITHADQPPQIVTDSMTWASSKPEVASIDANGLASAGQTFGETTIKAESKGMSATTELEVVKFEINPLAPTINTGETQLFVASITHTGQQPLNVKAVWDSTDPTIATIDTNGLAIAGSIPGLTIISATYNGMSTSTILHVNKQEFLSITPQIQAINIGDTFPFTATVTSANQQIDVTNEASWSSSDSGIASVDPGGRVTGYAVGTITIHVSYKGLNASATVNVLFNPYKQKDGLIWEKELSPEEIDALTKP